MSPYVGRVLLASSSDGRRCSVRVPGELMVVEECTFAAFETIADLSVGPTSCMLAALGQRGVWDLP